MGDQPDRTHQNFDCVSNRFVVVDYGNYWSAIWHLARPVTARHLYGTTDVAREILSSSNLGAKRNVLRLYDCIEFIGFGAPEICAHGAIGVTGIHLHFAV